MNKYAQHTTCNLKHQRIPRKVRRDKKNSRINFEKDKVLSFSPYVYGFIVSRQFCLKKKSNYNVMLQIVIL